MNFLNIWKVFKMSEIRKLSCHCGSVEIKLTMPDGLRDLRRCDCSMCARRGAVMASVGLDELEIVKGHDEIRLYQFNTNVAKHYFCSNCGIYTHHQRRSDPNGYGVNVAAIEGVNIRELGDIKWVDGLDHPSDR